jgi:hypothetical protein
LVRCYKKKKDEFKKESVGIEAETGRNIKELEMQIPVVLENQLLLDLKLEERNFTETSNKYSIKTFTLLQALS